MTDTPATEVAALRREVARLTDGIVRIAAWLALGADTKAAVHGLYRLIHAGAHGSVATADGEAEGAVEGSSAVVRAIDPPGCVCADCEHGLSVPLDRASAEQVLALARGVLADRSGTELRVELTVTAPDGLSWSAPLA